MSYYDDDDEVDVRIRHRREASPGRAPVHYVEARAPRPSSYYATGRPAFLVPERTMVTTRTRERSRERRSSPPSQAPAAAGPIVINNYTGHSSSDDDSYYEEHDMGMSRHRSHSMHGRGHSHSHSHSHSRVRDPSSGYMTREEYELERAREEIENLKLAQSQALQSNRKYDDYELRRAKEELDRITALQERERNDRQREQEYRHLERDYKDKAELSRAKRELDEIKRREEKELEQKRMKKELELRQLEIEKRAAEEKEKLSKLEKDVIERYKVKEAERIAREKREKEAAEKEYQRRLQEDLIKSGLDEKEIQAILKKEKIKKEKPQDDNKNKERATYTRMARRHLSIETLRIYGIDYELDQDPEFILIKRWVPEDEQNRLWKHTRVTRERRSKLYLEFPEEAGHHRHHSVGHLEPEYEWVRKKEKKERRRSKSPGLLMYLAGAK